MAPKQPPQPYAKDEKVLCFHHEMLYEAKILDVQPSPEGPEAGHQYKVHYKGWKATWDDWVPADRIRKHNPENVELAAQLMAQVRSLTQKGAAKARKGKAAAESARGSEERGGQAGRGPRRTRDYELEQVGFLCLTAFPLYYQTYARTSLSFHHLYPTLYPPAARETSALTNPQDEGFHSRPSIKLPIPDYIKSVLVDDWENITRNNQLVPIPHPHPVSEVFADYLTHERARRGADSALADILEETFAGLREYFERSVPRILLYR